MPTKNPRRAELASAAAALRAQGHTLREIAARLEVPFTSVHPLIADPDGSVTRKRARQRRRRTPDELARMEAQPGEFDADDMAWVVSVYVGFPVGRNQVMAAARAHSISSRKGLGGKRLFRGDVVLAEIDVGRWRPHRSTRGETWVPQTCANLRCTRGPDGQRAQRVIRRSHEARLVNLWRCSKECEEKVGGKRRPNRSPRRRRCGCLARGAPCRSVIAITSRQEATGKGRRRCESCRREGIRPEMSLRRCQAWRDADPEWYASRVARLDAHERQKSDHYAQRHQQDREWHRHRVEALTGRGQRNATSKQHMDNLSQRRMRYQAARQELQKERIGFLLRADPMQSNMTIATAVGRCGTERVAWLRWQLEQAGEIPQRPNLNGKARRAPTRNPFAPCEYTDEIRQLTRDAANPNRRRARPLHDAGLSIGEIALELGHTERHTRWPCRDFPETPALVELREKRKVMRTVAAHGSVWLREVYQACSLKRDDALALAQQLERDGELRIVEHPRRRIELVSCGKSG